MAFLEEALPLWHYNLAALAVYFILLIAFRDSSNLRKEIALYVMCAVCFAFYLVNGYYFLAAGQHFLTMFPLQLCNISVFLMPIALKTRNQILLDFAFYACVPGALAALLTPNSAYLNRTYSLLTISFFIFHFLIAAIPFLLTGWGIYKPSPSIGKALRLSATILLLGAVMHGFNLFLINQFGVESNYFFTVARFSTHLNPVFALFYSWIPFDFLYLLPALPVLYLYMAIVALFTPKERDRIGVRIYG